MDFRHIKKQVQAQFTELTRMGKLFVVDIDKEEIWQAYLEGFSTPESRQEHNCNGCRQFIKHYGGVVAIVDGRKVSIWDVEASSEWQGIVDRLRDLVVSKPIRDIFVTKQAKLGVDLNRVLVDGTTITWEHFYYELPRNLVERSSDTEATIQNRARSLRDVFKRSMEELTEDSALTVLELIAQGSLYRGEEYRSNVEVFLRCKREWQQVEDKDTYYWEGSIKHPAGAIRNTAIGTLLIDLSEGRDLDAAIGTFQHSIMAPTNFKRPKTNYTQRMVDEAEKKIVEMGLEGSLARRFATADDISVRDVLYVDRSKKQGGIFNELRETIPINPKSLSKVEEISMVDFLANVVPMATSIEVLLEGKHEGNLVSLIAPVNSDSPSLFKWGNGFSWSYKGEVADSIKQRVKAAGGKIEGELRISLSWNNYDDLDLRLKEPNGNEIFFGNKRSSTGGHLDLDENVSARTRTPAENIIYPYGCRILEGRYKPFVHNFNHRESIAVGFTVEIECQGQVYNYSYDQEVRYKEFIYLPEFTYTKAGGLEFHGEMNGKVNSRELWGMQTNTYQKVSMITTSPNYWGQGIGNKHWFIFLADAKNTDELVRGFYNEFLPDSLLEQRKVFEALGARMIVQPSDRQLSGIGFSTTSTGDFTCRVKGSFERVLKVII